MMKIKINNKNLTSKDAEDLINQIISHAEKCAEVYDFKNDYCQGCAQAYSEILDTTHNWGIIAEARISRNLEKWATKHLA